MQYWLLKSESDVWSINQQMKAGFSVNPRWQLDENAKFLKGAGVQL